MKILVIDKTDTTEKITLFGHDLQFVKTVVDATGKIDENDIGKYDFICLHLHADEEEVLSKNEKYTAKIVYLTGGLSIDNELATYTLCNITCKEDVENLPWKKVPTDFKGNKEEFVKKLKKEYTSCDFIAAIALLCQGYLAIWASQLKTEAIAALDGEPIKSALDNMGWNNIDPTSLSADLLTNLDTLSSQTWWRQCFGSKKVVDLADSELNGNLNDKKHLKQLAEWIDTETAVPADFELIVAGAYNELCKEFS